ncbi:MAG: RimK/LysX family protein [bacterium]|nr:RimK/LysX family protein [bacterium]
MGMGTRSPLSACRRGAAALAFFFLFALLSAAPAAAGGKREKTVIGPIEKVILQPWGIALEARIDTGAARSSLDARNIEAKGDHVEFDVHHSGGVQKIRLPVKKWKKYRSSSGRSRRPIVVMEFCLAGKRLRIPINLRDRAHMRFPFLVGRITLTQGNFLVDVTREEQTAPGCEKGKP